MRSNHPPEIYQQHSSGDFVIPFNLEVSPMERLLLINFEHDPDQVYVGFEPQVFDHPSTGSGLLVIAYRKDGKIDLYHQPGLVLAPENYDIVRKGLDDMIERSFENAHFEIGAQGVDVRFAFEDKQGRQISARIQERSRKPRKPFSLLAPFPGDTENPPSLPLVLLYSFYFVRKSNTDVEIKIGEKSHRLDSLPVPMDGTWMYFTRYASDLFLLNWNKAYSGALDKFDLPAEGKFLHQGVIYDLVENSGHLEISRMRPQNGSHDVQFIFEPPFPHLTDLRDSVEVQGIFTIWMEESMGKIDGVYKLTRSGSQVEIEVHPSEGWYPRVSKWSLWFIFRVAPIFKNWPKTYLWTARVDLSSENLPRMESKWNRI